METQKEEQLQDTQATAAVAPVTPENPAAETEAQQPQQDPPGGVPGSRSEHIKAALEVLYQRYPKCFFRDGDLKPLKVGILEDLKKAVPEMEGMSISKLRAAVRMYTTRLRYLYNVQEGVMRIDLDGNETEACTAEHQAYAKEKFNEINTKRKENQLKKQQMQEQGQKPGQRPGRKFNGKPGFRKGGKPGFQNRQGGKPFNREGGFQRRDGAPRPQGQFRQGPRPEGFKKPAPKVGFAGTAGSRLKKDFKVPRITINASSHASELTQGTEVLVKTQAGFSRGTVKENAQGGVVTVTMQNGMTLTLPVSRVSVASN